MVMNLNLLLISNSKHSAHPGKYLAYCEQEVKEHLSGIKRLLFIPYAEPGDMDNIVAMQRQDAHNGDLSIPSPERRYFEYTQLLQKRFAEMGIELLGIQDDINGPVAAISQAEAVYVGGGNTFDLLKTLYVTGTLEPLRQRIREGMPYLGVSAGTVIAGMNMCSTNDNPKPLPSIEALQVLPFCIKPHYQDKVTVSEEVKAQIKEIDPKVVQLLDHQGESHADRIREFHHTFAHNVLGLREGSILHVKGNALTLQGYNTARLFRPGRMMADYMPLEEFSPGTSLDFLLKR